MQEKALGPPQLSCVQVHKWPHANLRGQSQAGGGGGTGFMLLRKGKQSSALVVTGKWQKQMCVG